MKNSNLSMKKVLVLIMCSFMGFVMVGQAQTQMEVRVLEGKKGNNANSKSSGTTRFIFELDNYSLAIRINKNNGAEMNTLYPNASFEYAYDCTTCSVGDQFIFQAIDPTNGNSVVNSINFPLFSLPNVSDLGKTYVFGADLQSTPYQSGDPIMHLDASYYSYHLGHMNPLDLEARYSLSGEGHGGQLEPIFERLTNNSYQWEKYDGQYYHPNFFNVIPYNQGGGDESTDMYTSAEAFTKNTSIEVGISGKTPKGTSASVEGSWNEFTAENSSERNFYASSYKENLIYKVLLAEPRLTSTFINDAINLLKNPTGTKQFVEKYGTHYPEDITYGGRITTLFKMNQSTYSRLHEEGFTVSASIKQGLTQSRNLLLSGNGISDKNSTSEGFAVTGGGGVSNSESFQSALSTSRMYYYYQGGKANSPSQWVLRDDGRDSRAIKINFGKLSDLITTENFPTLTANEVNNRKNRLLNEINSQVEGWDEVTDIAPPVTVKAKVKSVRLDRIRKDGDAHQAVGTISLIYGNGAGNIATAAPMTESSHRLNEGDNVEFSTSNEISSVLFSTPSVSWNTLAGAHSIVIRNSFYDYDRSSSNELIGHVNKVHTIRDLLSSSNVSTFIREIVIEDSKQGKVVVTYEVEVIKDIFN